MCPIIRTKVRQVILGIMPVSGRNGGGHHGAEPLKDAAPHPRDSGSHLREEHGTF